MMVRIDEVMVDVIMSRGERSSCYPVWWKIDIYLEF